MDYSKRHLPNCLVQNIYIFLELNLCSHSVYFANLSDFSNDLEDPLEHVVGRHVLGYRHVVRPLLALAGRLERVEHLAQRVREPALRVVAVPAADILFLKHASAHRF